MHHDVFIFRALNALNSMPKVLPATHPRSSAGLFQRTCALAAQIGERAQIGESAAQTNWRIHFMFQGAWHKLETKTQTTRGKPKHRLCASISGASVLARGPNNSALQRGCPCTYGRIQNGETS